MVRYCNPLYNSPNGVCMITERLSQFWSKHRQIGTGDRRKHGIENALYLSEIGKELASKSAKNSDF